ncbi:MAG: phosphatase PAP2 family protein [Bryobacterales bacterium]|nr:phosphatase PAP2 family protein [Bryobacterales bacterium]
MNEKWNAETLRPAYVPVMPVDWSRVSRLFRPSEWVVLLYFTYTAVLTASYPVPPGKRLAAVTVPVLLFALGVADSRNPRRWTSIVRDWLPAALVLGAYWQLDWYQSPHRMVGLEKFFLRFDQTILNQAGLHKAIESMGPVIPSVLEVAYTLLYAIPPLSIAALYLYGKRRRVDRFLFPFLLSTFCAYALLPHFPTASPRFEFPGLDLPAYSTVWRRLNEWILGRGDIDTSVFPSGHVTTAFSAAFAMMRTLPEKPAVGRILLVMAVLVATATVYGRYHYAADAMAGFAISILALGFSMMVRHD